MSHVTDIILVTGICDDGPFDTHPNVDLLSQKAGFKLEKVDKYAGGDKAMQCSIFLASINYLDIEQFTVLFRSIPWENPEMVQLFLKDEDEKVFVEIKLNQFPE